MFMPMPYGSIPRASINVVIEVLKNGYIVRYSYVKKKPTSQETEFSREDIVEEAIIMQTEEEVANLLRHLKAQISS